MVSKKCVICGKPSGMYPLCTEHLEMKAEGKVIKCPDCGTWHLIEETCNCKSPKFTTLPTEGYDNCIICNNNSNGYAFCKDCFKKFSTCELLDILNHPEIKDNKIDIVNYKKIDTKEKENNTNTILKNEKNNFADSININFTVFNPITKENDNYSQNLSIGMHIENPYYGTCVIEKIDIINERIYFSPQNNKTENNSWAFVTISSYLSNGTIIVPNENVNTINQENIVNDLENSINKEELIINNNVITINEENKSKCITCGIKTNGLLFCPNCYHKYKNKELLFKITNCSCIELLDESYEGHRTCKDGHIVKSKSEREIDNYLFDHGIYHAYEKELSYGSSANETLHPDFCLPNYLGQGKDVYIEHWGYNENNIKYTNTKKFKMPIYKKLNITLVCTFEQTDMNNIESVLDRKLNKNFIKENEINFDE